MTPASTRRPCLFLVALLGCSLLLGACTEETTNVLPSEPKPGCTAAKPASLAAEVDPNDCTENGCRATFSVPSRGLEVISWTFNGGSPSQSGNASGTVTYRPVPPNFPADFSWALSACSCAADVDPTGKSCASTNGRVVFSTP